MLNTKKLLNSVLVLFILISFISFIPYKSNASSNEVINWGDKVNVEPNKEWKIKFNRNISLDFVNSSYFYVLDKNGEKHPTEIYLDMITPDTVSVFPTNNYKDGKAYTLFVKSGIKSLDGRKINKPVIMNFKIKDGKIKPTIVQEQGSNGTASVKLTISLKDGNDVPLSGYKANDFNVRIRQLSNYIYGFSDYYPFSNFLEKEKGLYTIDFEASHNSIYDLIDLKAKEDILSQHITIKTPKNIAELTNFPDSYRIKEIPSVIRGITNPDEGKKLSSGFIQIQYNNYSHEYYNLNLNASGNWVYEDVWIPVKDVSNNDDLSIFTLALNQDQLNAIYLTKEYGGNSNFDIRFKGLYGNQRIITNVKYFSLD